MDATTYCGFYCKRCPEFENSCPGCRKGGGVEHCKPRDCAQQMDVRLCAQCSEFPCAKLGEHVTRFPFLLNEALEIQKGGLDAWITAQERLIHQKYY